MKKLIVHIGHGKTGTSYIQSALSMNVEALRMSGIEYPYHRNFENAQKSLISSGNGALLLSNNVDFSDDHTILLSSEFLFSALTKGTSLYDKVIKKVDELVVVLYSRDVMEMFISSWGQCIKRHGETLGFEEWLKKNNPPHYKNVIWWIEASKKFNFTLRVRNYSKLKNDIFFDFLNFIAPEIDLNKLNLPESKVVNRSLTNFESNFLRVINSFDKDLGYKLSDQLVNTLPDVNPSSKKISDIVFKEIKNNYDHLVEKINCHLSYDDRLIFGDSEQYVGVVMDNELSYDQLQVISNIMSSNLLSDSKSNNNERLK